MVHSGTSAVILVTAPYENEERSRKSNSSNQLNLPINISSVLFFIIFVNSVSTLVFANENSFKLRRLENLRLSYVRWLPCNILVSLNLIQSGIFFATMTLNNSEQMKPLVAPVREEQSRHMMIKMI